MQQRIGATGEAVGHIFNDWRDDGIAWVRHDGLKLLAILVVAFILLQALRLFTARMEAYSRNQPLPSGMRAQQLRTLAGIIESFGSFVIYFLLVLQALPLFGLDIKPILASAGIAGLALGFGAQTLVKDFINGFFIFLENQYDVGDVVKIAGVTGNVEIMSLRKTTLRDANGTVHTVPNSEIKVVSNFTRDWAQVSLHVSADYNENSEKVVKLLQEVGAELYNDERFKELMVAEPEVPGIERVTGREVDYLMLAKVKPGQQWLISRELRRRVKECFEKHGINAAAPARIYVADSGHNAPETEVK